MPDEVKPDPKQTADVQEAELAAEQIAEGTEKAPEVDVDKDYEASKELSVSNVDKSGSGTQAAQTATSPQQKVPEPTDMSATIESTGNPDDYREIAQDVNPRANE